MVLDSKEKKGEIIIPIDNLPTPELKKSFLSSLKSKLFKILK